MVICNKTSKAIEYKILKIYNNSSGAWKSRNIMKIKKWVDYINNKYANPNMSFGHKLKLLNNGNSFIPKCIECNNPVNFIDKKTCSNKCKGIQAKRNSVKRLKKFKQTMLSTYGVDNPQKIKFISAKRIKTLEKKYGAKVSPTTRKQAKLRVKSLIIKGRKTLKEKYNVNNPGQLPNHKEKCKATLLKNYGVDNYFKSTNFLIKKTQKQILNIAKISPKSIKLIGINQASQNLREIYNNPNNRISFICITCNTTETLPWETYKFRLRNYHTPCGKCSKISGNYSAKEKEILQFIQTIYNGLILENTKKIITPYELDIMIPDLNIAIEFCGLYWHNDQRISKQYHLNKLNLCLEQKIRLITIFEDEWDHKQEIVKQRLKYLIKHSKPKFYARNCINKIISTKDAKKFCKTYHIQGYTGSSIKIGSYYNDNKLVAVMTFSKPNKSKGSKIKENIWELSRFCSKTNIPGIASKLFKYFLYIKQPTLVYSYSCKRWNTGKVYEELNMTKLKDTSINYWYIEGTKRIHRYNLRKIKTDNQKLTEWENRQAQGWKRIWDCGSFKYLWEKN